MESECGERNCFTSGLLRCLRDRLGGEGEEQGWEKRRGRRDEMALFLGRVRGSGGVGGRRKYDGT